MFAEHFTIHLTYTSKTLVISFALSMFPVAYHLYILLGWVFFNILRQFELGVQIYYQESNSLFSTLNLGTRYKKNG